MISMINKTTLVARPDTILPGVTTIEVWYKGILIGTITGADGPGVRVISKYLKTVHEFPPLLVEVHMELDT